VTACFAVFSYSYFSTNVNASSDACHSFFQCVSVFFADSLTGDVSTVLGDDFGEYGFPALAPQYDGWGQSRSLFAVVAIIFWVFLLQGIIQGQIIDAFAEMRNKRNADTADLETKCFISSIERFVFNDYPGEWEKRQAGRYAWKYLLFFLFLFDKDPEEYNGLENYVYKAFLKDDVSFLPILRFLALQRRQQKHKTLTLETASVELQERVDKLEAGVHHVAHTLRRVTTQLRGGPSYGSHGSSNGPASMSSQGASFDGRASPVMAPTGAGVMGAPPPAAGMRRSLD